MDAPVKTPPNKIEAQLKPDDVGARGFLKWLKLSMPALYKGIEGDVKRLQAQARMAGFGTFGESGVSAEVPASSGSASSTWIDNITKLVGAWGQYKLTDQQLDTVKQITQVNLQRAQQGLAPLPYDASQMGLAPTVNVGLSSDTSRLVSYGAMGIGAVLLLAIFARPRRAR